MNATVSKRSLLPHVMGVLDQIDRMAPEPPNRRQLLEATRQICGQQGMENSETVLGLAVDRHLAELPVGDFRFGWLRPNSMKSTRLADWLKRHDTANQHMFRGVLGGTLVGLIVSLTCSPVFEPENPLRVLLPALIGCLVAMVGTLTSDLLTALFLKRKPHDLCEISEHELTQMKHNPAQKRYIQACCQSPIPHLLGGDITRLHALH